MSAPTTSPARAARRAPRRLAPVVALLLLAGLAGCGGDGGGADAAAVPQEPAPTVPQPPAPAAPVVVVDRSTAVAGDARIGAPVLALLLPGPVLQLERPALVVVHLQGSAAVGAHYGAVGSATLELAGPLPAQPTTVPLVLSPQAQAVVALDYTVHLQLPAGAYALQAQIMLRAADANGRPTGALAEAQAVVDWRVEVAP